MSRDGGPGLRLRDTLPKPKLKLTSTAARPFTFSRMYEYLGMGVSPLPHLTVSDFVTPAKERPDLLAGLEELVAGLDDFESGVAELPEGRRDLTSYVDAFASAAKNCRHEDYEDTMYAKREAKCNDCGAYFKRPRSPFG